MRYTIERRRPQTGRWVPLLRSDPAEGPVRYRTLAAAERARDLFCALHGWNLRIVPVEHDDAGPA